MEPSGIFLHIPVGRLRLGKAPMSINHCLQRVKIGDLITIRYLEGFPTSLPFGDQKEFPVIGFWKNSQGKQLPILGAGIHYRPFDTWTDWRVDPRYTSILKIRKLLE